MTIEPYLAHLKEVAKSDIKKSEKKVIEKFIGLLNHIENMNLSSSQEEEMMIFIDALKLKTYRGGNKRVILKKMNQLTDYLKTEYSLISEGYYISLGIALGPGFGLSLGISMATALGFDISMGLTYGLIVGMLIGIFVGIYLDDAAKKNGKVISEIS